MSNIGFMRNTVDHIESLFNYYFKNKKISVGIGKGRLQEFCFPNGAHL